MHRRKIIFVHLLNDYSGSPKVLSQVISTINNNQYDLELYTGNSGDGFLSGILDKHSFYFYKRFDNKYLTLISFLLSQISLFLKLLKYRDDEVLIYINTLLPFGAGLAGKIMRKKVYYHIHETSIEPKIFKKFLRYFVQKTASKVLFVSNSLKESENFKGIKQEVIYNALSTEFVKTAKSTKYEHTRNSKFNVLMICSLKDYKGVKEFIRIADECKTKSDILFTLVLNAEQIDIDAYFEDQNIPSNIVIFPKQKNVIKFYKETSLLLNLSRVDQWVETFGLTILEAMAFGIPVIVPPVGGPMEIVRDTTDGYHISSYNIGEIAELIKKLSYDENLCLYLSENARDRVEYFDEKTFKLNIMKVINE